VNPGIRSKNKRANQENWPIPSHHKNDPIAYPNIAPKIEQIKVEEPPKRKAGIKVSSVAELVQKLKNEAKVI